MTDTAPPAAPLPGALDADRLRDWHRDGFLVLDRFLDEATLRGLRTAYDDVLAGRVHAPGDRMLGEVTRQVMRPSRAHPLFDANPALDAALAIARQVFGTDVHRTYDMLIYKPPGHREETPWHQDHAYSAMPFAAPGTEVVRDSIQFWVPLDDVDTDTGCMQFVPGHHTGPLMEHHVHSGAPEDEGRLLALVDPAVQLDLSARVVAEMPAGGATLHAANTAHYTGPNRSTDRHRRSYIFNVAPVG